METAFRDIVSDELQKIKQTSSSKNQITFVPNDSDLIWEFDGLHTSSSTETESEELMLEMERVLYEDLREELIRRGKSCRVHLLVILHCLLECAEVCMVCYTCSF